MNLDLLLEEWNELDEAASYFVIYNLINLISPTPVEMCLVLGYIGRWLCPDALLYNPLNIETKRWVLEHSRSEDVLYYLYNPTSLNSDEVDLLKNYLILGWLMNRSLQGDFNTHNNLTM